MKQYKRIGHQKTYQAHQFCYEKIELSEDFPTDKPDEECFRELLERIEALAKVAYPWLFDIQLQSIMNLEVTAPMQKVNYTNTNEKTNGQEQPEEQKPLLQLIQESKTVRELKSWELLIKVEKDKVKREELSTTYVTKLAELAKQKTTA